MCTSKIDYAVCYTLNVSIVTLILFLLSPSESYGEFTNNSNNGNQTKTDNSFLIKFSSRGGYAGSFNSIFYNSTDNHLLRIDEGYDTVLPGITLSESISEVRLNSIQQNTLRKMINYSDFFKISFDNEKPDCCDLKYYQLKIISGDKVNTVHWTSANIGNESDYKEIPIGVTNFVETLFEFSENSTRLYTESDLEEIKLQKESDLLRKADSLLAQQNYSDAILWYDKVLAINPNETDALVYKAHALTSLGQHENALLLVDSILNFNQGDTYYFFDHAALLEKGVILSNMGKDEEALFWINKALQVNPSNNAQTLLLKKELEAKIK